MPCPVIYLDVDDTVAADHADRAWAGELRDATVTQVLSGGFAMRFKVRFAVLLIRELDRLISDFNVELVWNSSWNDDLLITRKLTAKFDGLQGGRVLPYPYGATGDNGSWKGQALLRDQAADPRPFIWADDKEVPAHGAAVRTATKGTPSLLLAPEPNIGLTPTHVELMREFLTAVS